LGGNINARGIWELCALSLLLQQRGNNQLKALMVTTAPFLWSMAGITAGEAGMRDLGCGMRLLATMAQWRL